MSIINMVSRRKLTVRERLLRDAKKELKSFLPAIKKIKEFDDLKPFLDQARKHSQGLTLANRALLCGHHLAVNAAVKRGYWDLMARDDKDKEETPEMKAAHDAIRRAQLIKETSEENRKARELRGDD